VNVDSIPELEGVEHRLIDLGGGVTIHVADAGPADGPPGVQRGFVEDVVRGGNAR
jgi:hypothetical protein